MESTNNKVNDEIARYKSGSRDDEAVDSKIAKAWSEIVNNKREELAKLLDVPASSLDPTKPPFRAATQAGGVGVVEIAIIFVGGVIGGFVKDLGTEAGKAAAKKLRKVWSQYMAKQVSNPKDPALGDRIDEDT